MSYRGIFDTHAHYDDKWFDEDRAQTLSFIQSSGVSAVINCGCDYNSSVASIGLSENFDFIYAAIGIHPENPEEKAYEELEKIRQLYKNNKVIAIGEIGLDYHWDTMPRDKQRDIFQRQLVLSRELNLPVIVHDRDAHGDTLELLSKNRVNGVLHCFGGSLEMAKEILKLDMYIGLGGVVTFKNARKSVEVAEAIPLDRLLLETDCPYMAPVPFRGKRCDSSMIAHTAEFIAGLRNMDTQELIDICNENAKRLFNIK